MQKFTKYILVLLSLFFNLTYSQDDIFWKLQEAIEICEVAKVKEYLEISKSVITLEKKDLLLNKVRDLVASKEKKLSIFLSRSDAMRLFFGIGVNAMGIAIILRALISSMVDNLVRKIVQNRVDIKNNKLEKKRKIFIGLGASTSLFGIYNMYKGWTLSSAYSSLNKARKIEELIQDFNVSENN